MLPSPFGVYTQNIRYYVILFFTAPLLLRITVLIATPPEQWTLGQGGRLLLLSAAYDLMVAMILSCTVALIVLMVLRTTWRKPLAALLRFGVTATVIAVLLMFYRAWNEGTQWQLGTLKFSDWWIILLVPLLSLGSILSTAHRYPARLYNISVQRLLVGTGHVWFMHTLLAVVLLMLSLVVPYAHGHEQNFSLQSIVKNPFVQMVQMYMQNNKQSKIVLNEQPATNVVPILPAPAPAPVVVVPPVVPAPVVVPPPVPEQNPHAPPKSVEPLPEKTAAVEHALPSFAIEKSTQKPDIKRTERKKTHHTTAKPKKPKKRDEAAVKNRTTVRDDALPASGVIKNGVVVPIE